MRLRIPSLGRGSSAITDGDRADPLAAIDRLNAENRELADGGRERCLVELRNLAYDALQPSPTPSAPERLDRVPGGRDHPRLVSGLPELTRTELDATAVRGALLSHGAVLVRGLVRPERAAELAAGIDRAFDGRDAFLGGAPAKRSGPWFVPFSPPNPTDTADWNRFRAKSGSVWLADSPRMMFELLETFDRSGISVLAAEYLGERPVLSMSKSVLRRVSPESGAAWHQDGAFLGEGIRTLNVWLALSHCGDTAPGLDLLPRRLEEIVPTGTEGALFDWAVSDSVAEELAGGRPIARPIFEPGDAVLFDHLCLHRTAAEPGMPAQRYATETWCFAPSAYPQKLVPLVI